MRSGLWKKTHSQGIGLGSAFDDADNAQSIRSASLTHDGKSLLAISRCASRTSVRFDGFRGDSSGWPHSTATTLGCILSRICLVKILTFGHDNANPFFFSFTTLADNRYYRPKESGPLAMKSRLCV